MICPCTASLSLGATKDRCKVVLVFDVKSGEVEGTDVSGLTVAAVCDTPKVMSEGNWRLGVVIDAEASDEQAEKLGGVFSGALGGPMEALGPLVGENLGVERQPIEVQEDGLTHSVRIGDEVDFEIEDVVPFGVGDRGTGQDHAASSTRPAPSSPSRGPPARRSTPSASSTRPRPGSRPRSSPGRPERRVLPGSAPVMESATIRRLPALPGLIQLGLIALLVLLAAVAWVITSEQMDGMDAGPGTDPGALGFFVGVWVVMMAAMMFPSIAPMVMMHVRIQEGRRERGQAGVAGATALFVGGYLLAWSAAGLIGYGIFQLGKAVTGDLFSWDDAGPYLAGGIVCAAAIYQLTPLKDVCLRHCRSPFAFLMQHWHAGRLGSLRMGVVHGGWCIGCCWALMAALFALGVMSLGWMAFIAALIAVEKLLPWKTLANRGIAVLLLVLGLAIAFTPASVPGLTLPGSAEAMQGMGSGSMDSMSGDGGNDEPSQGNPMDSAPDPMP